MSASSTSDPASRGGAVTEVRPVRPHHVVTVVLRPSPWFTVEVTSDGLKIDPAGDELTWDQAQLFKRLLEASVDFIATCKRIEASERHLTELRLAELRAEP